MTEFYAGEDWGYKTIPKALVPEFEKVLDWWTAQASLVLHRKEKQMTKLPLPLAVAFAQFQGHLVKGG